MPTWAPLIARLKSASGEVHLSWDELESLVGPLPPSASQYRAWWSGSRPHVRAWESAGFCLSEVVLGTHVAFTPREAPPQAESPLPTDQAVGSAMPPPPRGAADALLVTCVKSKLTTPAAARDLYVSPLFRKQRAYAEALGVPWFILSAEHALVQPDEWLAPYERYLPDTPAAYQRAWGFFVAERLTLLIGPLNGRVVEVHASRDYVSAIRGPLEAKGAKLNAPLDGLSHGKRLQWYDTFPSATGTAVAPTHAPLGHVKAEAFVADLLDGKRSVAPRDFLHERPDGSANPGLYSWWVDEEGASDLSGGLGHPVTAGLIYAGLAGATRWPSGRKSRNTLWSRIVTMHLGGNHEFSTFRRTLGSLLAHAAGRDEIDESALTSWMHEHLRVIAVPFEDADTLGHLESAVLEQLDPPLNLQGMPPSSVRARLKELRRTYR